MRDYDHKEIEKKWQDEWEKNGIYRAHDDSDKPKKYVLDMFPYPSGAGLHVGHVEGYTATDVYSRYMRMKGFNVLHPIGWDSFGLPAENYAIKTKIPPKETTEKAIAAFTKQIRGLGLSYDWSREIGTHTPEYYQWTQWFFLTLFENGLAEKKKAKVNWCPKDQTVLANEQVVDGLCERCGTAVIQKDLEQWFFKITEFADALIDDLDTVDWPQSTKSAQKNWIGRKAGIIVTHKVKGLDITLETFSAYPAWLFADTYMVLAPEHPQIPELIAGTETEKEVTAFILEARNATDIERMNPKAEKKGIFTGRYALDPLTKKEFPIWIANFALMDFGTGIIRCSGHDDRDVQFAKKYGLPLHEVVERTDPNVPVNAHGNQGVLKDSGPFSGRSIDDALIAEIIRWIEENNYGRAHITYRLRDWLVSRQRYWGAPIPIVYDPEGKAHPVPEKHLPWLLPTDVEFKPTGVSPLGQSKELLERTERIFGKGWRPEIDTLDTFVCSSWYFFRFADPKNSEEFASADKIKKWLPVDMYMGGAEHTVLHLMYARFFTKVLKKLGFVGFSEPFSKLRHQGTILAEDGKKMSKSLGNVINPDEVSELYGADTIRIYEMFMGPLETMKPWNTKSIMGPRRFVERVWRLSGRVAKDADSSDELTQSMHASIKKVGEDIEELSLNTAISQMMIFLNTLEKYPAIPAFAYESLLKILAPFAPHIVEELWRELGYQNSIHLEPWPAYDPSKLESDTVTIAVQVGGKTKGSISVPRNTTQEEAIFTAQNNAKIGKLVPEKPSRIVYVPGRILNFIP